MTKKIEALKATIKAGHADRYTFLAYAFLRGRPYHAGELTARCGPDASYVGETVGETTESVQAWLDVPATEVMLIRAAQARAAFIYAKRLRGAKIRGERETLAQAV